MEIDYDFTNNRVEAIRLKGTQHSGDPIDPKLETEVPDPEAEQEELPQEGEGTLSCPSKETERREEEEDTLSLPAWDEDDGIVPEIVGPND